MNHFSLRPKWVINKEMVAGNYRYLIYKCNIIGGYFLELHQSLESAETRLKELSE